MFFLPSVGKTLVGEQVADVPEREPLAGGSSAEDIPGPGKTESRKDGSVTCQAIIDAYHEILPELPRAAGGKEQRKHIRARWKESAERLRAYYQWHVLTHFNATAFSFGNLSTNPRILGLVCEDLPFPCLQVPAYRPEVVLCR